MMSDKSHGRLHPAEVKTQKIKKKTGKFGGEIKFDISRLKSTFDQKVDFSRLKSTFENKM